MILFTDVIKAINRQRSEVTHTPNLVIINPRDYMRITNIKHLPRKLKKQITGAK